MVAQSKPRVSPAFAWLFVFLPALGYFLSTRLSSGFWSELGDRATTDLLLRLGDASQNACIKLAETFYLASSTACANEPAATSVELSSPLQLVQDSGLRGVVDLLWRHDSELGRGYLLISDSAGKGRIWRWEVGGGPIAIGKTLHLEDSGCRSGLYRDCSTEFAGSGAMAIDFYRAGSPSEHASEGLLAVAEWGEGRIVRLEENGARTPLQMHVPCATCDVGRSEHNTATCSKRIPNVERMLFTPTGDLIVAVHYDGTQECRLNDGVADIDPNAAASSSSASLVQLSYAVHVTPLHSLQESRQAHAWTEVQHTHTARILYANPSVSRIGGMATTPTSLYATAMKSGEDGSSSIVILELSIKDEETDDDLEDSRDHQTGVKEAKVLLDLAEYAPGSQNPGALAVSQSGRLFAAVQDGVLILDGTMGVLGKLVVPALPTAVTLGGDGYLYVATSSRIYRIRTKEKPVELQTNRVARPPKMTTM